MTMNDLDISEERNLTVQEVVELMTIHAHIFLVYVLEDPNEGNTVLLTCTN